MTHNVPRLLIKFWKGKQKGLLQVLWEHGFIDPSKPIGHKTITTISEPTLDFLTLRWTALTLRKRIHFCNKKYLKCVIAAVSYFLVVYPNFTVNWLGREFSTIGYVKRNIIDGWKKQRRRVKIISEIVSQNQFPENFWKRPVSKSFLFAPFNIFCHTKQYRVKQTVMQNSSSTQKCYQVSSRWSALLSATNPPLTLTMKSPVI